MNNQACSQTICKVHGTLFVKTEVSPPSLTMPMELKFNPFETVRHNCIIFISVRPHPLLKTGNEQCRLKGTPSVSRFNKELQPIQLYSHEGISGNHFPSLLVSSLAQPDSSLRESGYARLGSLVPPLGMRLPVWLGETIISKSKQKKNFAIKESH